MRRCPSPAAYSTSMRMPVRLSEAMQGRLLNTWSTVVLGMSLLTSSATSAE